MPLRSASSSTKSTALGSPYSSPRRPSGQPRTSRMQYSACGACRMRRVRCDLKDQPYSGTGQPQCGNCTERGLRCIDEFADVKAVKLLRRGRRLQQVEAVYGKAADEDGLYGLPVLTPTLIAKLKPDFFSSSFFHRLFIQHPIIDPTEFLSRFFEFSSGNHGALGIAGQLIAMILVVWGSSFGVNEYGIEDPSTDFHTLHARRESTNELVREILQLVDMHGILRKPSFDGVRAVMLLLPLTEDVLNPTERLVIHEMLVAHVYTLCSLGSPSSIGSAQSQPVDTLVRARVFWYTHIVEGITSGLRGGRIVLSDDDLVMFNKSINVNIDSSTSRALQPLEWWSRFSSAPILLAGACRTIHSALTGPRARQDPVIDHKRIFEIWNTLDRVRSELEALRVLGRTNIPIVHDEDVERYCDGWQIFIFECHSRIRESLKQHMLVHPDRNGDAGEQCSASSLIQSSEARFRELAHYVAAIVKRHVVADSQFFEFDSTLACSGCFFAAFLLAGEGGSDDEVSYCLQALKRMRWVYSDAEDKERTVAMAWEARKARASSSSPSSSLNNGDSPDYNKLFSHTRHAPPPLAIRSLPTSTLADLPGAGANFEDGNWLTPPNSAGSSTQSFHGDARGPSSPHSSPLSVSSRQASGCGSPLGTTEFVAPGLLHPSSYSPLPLPPDDGARVEAFLYQPGVASYQIHGPQAGPGLTSIQSPHSGLAIGLPHAASPHALVSGNGSPSNMPNANARFESHAAAPTFDPRVLGFPSDPSHTLSGVSDALEQAFNLSGNFF